MILKKVFTQDQFNLIYHKKSRDYTKESIYLLNKETLTIVIKVKYIHLPIHDLSVYSFRTNAPFII